MTRHGRLPTETTASDPLNRLWQKVEKTDGCWLWTGARTSSGRYGHVRHKGKLMQAHRFAYTLLVAPIPAGLVIDHLCGTTLCVRPDHLEPVTQAENIRRAQGGTVDACKRGHAWIPENSRIRPDGKRTCRACAAAYQVERRARLASETSPPTGTPCTGSVATSPA